MKDSKSKRIIDKNERIKEGYVPDDEINDWYNTVYRLQLAVVSHKRKEEDQALTDLERAKNMAVDLLKKMEERKQHPDYKVGLDKSKKRLRQ